MLNYKSYADLVKEFRNPVVSPGNPFDVCDDEDSTYEQYFFAEYLDVEGISYDNIIGGGPCNQDGGCEYIDQTTDKAYCNHEDFPNICVYEGSCYLGDGSVILDIDGTDKHEAMCIGFGWWDLDAGTSNENYTTPLPGIEICEMGGYVWTTGEPGIGEYEWNFNGHGCCGDDEGEFFDGDVCATPTSRVKTPTLAKR